MSIIGKLIKTTIDIATIPVAVVKDVATLGGSITGERSAVSQKVEQLTEDVGEIKDEADRL